MLWEAAMEIVELGMDMGIVLGVAGLGILALPWKDGELGESRAAFVGALAAARRMLVRSVSRPRVVARVAQVVTVPAAH